MLKSTGALNWRCKTIHLRLWTCFLFVEALIDATWKIDSYFIQVRKLTIRHHEKSGTSERYTFSEFASKKEKSASYYRRMKRLRWWYASIYLYTQRYIPLTIATVWKHQGVKVFDSSSSSMLDASWYEDGNHLGTLPIYLLKYTRTEIVSLLEGDDDLTSTAPLSCGSNYSGMQEYPSFLQSESHHEAWPLVILFLN